MTVPGPPPAAEYRVWLSSLSLVPTAMASEAQLVAVLADQPAARGEIRTDGGTWQPYTPPEHT